MSLQYVEPIVSSFPIEIFAKIGPGGTQKPSGGGQGAGRPSARKAAKKKAAKKKKK